MPFDMGGKVKVEVVVGAVARDARKKRAAMQRPSDQRQKPVCHMCRSDTSSSPKYRKMSASVRLLWKSTSSVRVYPSLLCMTNVQFFPLRSAQPSYIYS